MADPIENGIAQVKSLGYFVREIGAAGVLSLGGLGLVVMIYLTWAGIVPSPVVTASAFEEHRANNERDHKETVKTQREQVKVLEKLSRGLDVLYCNQYPTEKEKSACFQRLREAELLQNEGKNGK